ncbi:MAG: hypothetical protein UT82_C0005G0041 [Parcubacteria group bacterium GW2011_GWB1_40_14]|nr:MAG: hypothetical protein UT82_C0005G0041 [Parcubacteria group bacterium GW2011_GWB1_40_14]
MKKVSLIIFFVIVVLGTAVFFVTHNPFEKKEGEVIIGDLIEQSRRNVPGATDNGGTENTASTIAPATYEGTLLVMIPENDQHLIREGGKELSFETYTPTKIPQGFSLSPTSISHGVQNNITSFHSYFSHANDDSVIIDEYRLQEYLTVTEQTISEFIGGKEPVIMGDKKIYIGDIQTKTSGRFQYYQGVTIIIGPVMIRVAYAGEKKLSNNDLAVLGASFTR